MSTVSVISEIWQNLGPWEPMYLTKGCHIRNVDASTEYAEVIVRMANMVASCGYLNSVPQWHVLYFKYSIATCASGTILDSKRTERLCPRQCCWTVLFYRIIYTMSQVYLHGKKITFRRYIMCF